MSIYSKPLNMWINAVELSYVMAESQAVIGMRVMGMAGIWSVTPSENARMVDEKIDAMTRSITEAGRVAMRGGSAEEITGAAIRPIRKKTRANVARLGKRGLRKK